LPEVPRAYQPLNPPFSFIDDVRVALGLTARIEHVDRNTDKIKVRKGRERQGWWFLIADCSLKRQDNLSNG